jgi:hypothetical protein
MNRLAERCRCVDAVLLRPFCSDRLIKALPKIGRGEAR